MNTVMYQPYILSCSDVDPDWLYADPNPQNLLNTDPEQVRIQVNQINFNPSFISQEKKYFQICTLTLEISSSYFSYVQTWKI